MPTYGYRCESCGHEFEEFQSIKADPIKVCPECKRPKVRRLIGIGSAVLFKGSGFYETDYRSKTYTQAAKADTSSSSSSASTSSSTDAASAGTNGSSSGKAADTNGSSNGSSGASSSGSGGASSNGSSGGKGSTGKNGSGK